MTLAEPKIRRWTRDEYYRLAEDGWFRGQRVQLIDGEIIQMAPQGHPHTRSLMCAKTALTGIFGSERIRPQLPLNVPGESDPEPDLAITERPFQEYDDHPVTAVLVIEISDSSIYLDRRKAGLYATAGVPDYWIVNVAARRVEVFRQPVPDPNHEFGHRYAEHFELDETGSIAAIASPNFNIPVKSLF